MRRQADRHVNLVPVRVDPLRIELDSPPGPQFAFDPLVRGNLSQVEEVPETELGCILSCNTDQAFRRPVPGLDNAVAGRAYDGIARLGHNSRELLGPSARE